MFYADTVGLSNVVNSIKQYAKGHHGEAWKVAPLLEKLAHEGKAFNLWHDVNKWFKGKRKALQICSAFFMVGCENKTKFWILNNTLRINF